MTQEISTAMILAAGLGTRMRPLSLETPKPLIAVNNKALIDHMLDPLLAAGVSRYVVNVHWLADKVESHIRGRQSEAEFIISDERETLLETGGGLAKARCHLGDDPIFVANTDAFWGKGTTTPLIKMMDMFDATKMDILLLLANRTRTLGFAGAGDFFLEESGQVKRRGDAQTAPYAFTGVRIINPKIYDDTAIAPFSSNIIWNDYLSRGRVYGCLLDDFWLHVGEPKALSDAEFWLKCH